MVPTEIVRDNDDTSLKLLDGNSERVNGFLSSAFVKQKAGQIHHIQVVSRLIKKQNVWVLHGKDGKDNSDRQQMFG